MKTFLIVLAILSFCPLIAAQTEKTRSPEQEFSYFKAHSFRPKLTLQEGMKLADSFIASEKIDVSKYWLYQAKYIIHGKDDASRGAGLVLLVGER